MTGRPGRVVLIVLDSVGVGELPDAASYGDAGSNTVGNIARRVPLVLPTLESLGLSRVVDLPGDRREDAPRGAFGRMVSKACASPGRVEWSKARRSIIASMAPGC